MTRKRTYTIDPLALLKAHGQIESADLAERCGISERALARQLYDSIAGGHVLSCKVIRPGHKSGTLYRWSGWTPPYRVGAPTAAERAAAVRSDEGAAA